MLSAVLCYPSAMEILSTQWPWIAVISVIFLVVYLVAYSVVMGIRDNYHRHAQKSRLQWTGPVGSIRSNRFGFRLLIRLVLLSVASALFVVRFVFPA